MRVLIVNANRERSPWPVPPLGACAVASAAQEAGHEVSLLDLCFAPKPARAIRRAVDSHKPDVIGVSIRNIDNVDWQCPEFYLPAVKTDVLDELKAAAPSCPIVLGGPAVGVMPQQILAYMEADYAVCGDGEVAIVALLEALGGSARPLSDVPGLTWREAGTFRSNPPARVADLDALPRPRAHEWLNLPRYLAYNGALGVQTKRGCALKCSYCVYNHIEGACYRLRSPALVVDEVAEAVAAGCHSVEFVDSTFNVPLDHAKEICRALIDRALPVQLNTMGINPGFATAELLDLLDRAGFSEISITPETASPPTLASLGKSFTREDLKRAAWLSRRSKLPVVWYFMFGAPGETEDTVRQTLQFAADHIPESHLVLMVTGIRILPGAPLADRARAEGQIAPDEALLEPVWYRPEIEPDRLFALLDEAMTRHPNWLALQDNHVPQPVIRAVSALHRLFGSRKPIWRYIRYLRRVQNALGLSPHFLAGGARRPA